MTERVLTLCRLPTIRSVDAYRSPFETVARFAKGIRT